MGYVEGISQWSQSEKEFNRLRGQILSQKAADYIDDFPVTARRQSICRMLARIKLFEKVMDVKGAVIECGVHRGAGLMLFYHLSSLWEPYAINRRIYGFDTFNGFPKSSPEDPLKVHEGTLSSSNYAVLREMIPLHDMNRPLSHMPKAELIKGDATVTIPEFVKKHPELIVSLLYLDFDLYEPTKTALRHFLPLVPKGGVVAFDELNAPKWAGETQAFKEFFNVNKVELKKFPFDPYIAYSVV
ncbi:MAG: TylF/MycF/NovP-related O-methyltransferase [Candidatus Omnitrophota bacterium]|nr:TylF/MycF/NovP-related O-methyltransferase [Candidatus Omnitrophota bacterium]